MAIVPARRARRARRARCSRRLTPDAQARTGAARPAPGGDRPSDRRGLRAPAAPSAPGRLALARLAGTQALARRARASRAARAGAPARAPRPRRARPAACPSGAGPPRCRCALASSAANSGHMRAERSPSSSSRLSRGAELHLGHRREHAGGHVRGAAPVCPRSSTATLMPRWRARQATDRPMMPPPTTATSTRSVSLHPVDASPASACRSRRRARLRARWRPSTQDPSAARGWPPRGCTSCCDSVALPGTRCRTCSGAAVAGGVDVVQLREKHARRRRADGRRQRHAGRCASSSARC